MDSAGAASADPAAELGSGQADDIANAPEQGHLGVGVDVALDAINFDLRH